LAVLVAGAGLALTSSSASASQTPKTARTAGIDRYATSALAATKAYPSGTNKMVLVSGADANWPDGLAASALAGAVDGPVILTNPDSLLGSTANAIGTLDTAASGTATVYIVGGTAAVSANVATQLEDLGYTVSRISGDDRYATADAVYDEIQSIGGIGSYDGGKAVIIATGENFPDALSVGAMAHSQVFPVLLTKGEALTAGTQAILDSETNAIKQAIVVGGTSAVSAAIATEVGAIVNTTAIEVTRVSGATRYDTAVEVATFMEKSTTLDGLGMTIDTALLVDGATHYDAVSAIGLAGNGQSADASGLYAAVSADNSVILLTDGGGSALHSSTSTYLGTVASSISQIRAIGTTSLISDAVLAEAKTAVTQVTPTVSATPGEGASSVTFTFSEAMTCVKDSTGAGLTTNYKKNNSTISGSDYVICAADKKSATLYLYGASGTSETLAVGDVITIAAITANGVTRASAATSFTVGNDITGPTVSAGKAYIGSANATVTFDSALASGTFAVGDLSSNKSNTFSSVTKSAYSNTWHIVTGSNIVTGETITVDKSGVTDVAGNAGASTYVITASSDSTKPSISSATIASTAHTAATATLSASTGAIKVVAKSTGVAPGSKGNGWTAEMIEGTATTNVTVNTTDKTVVIKTPVAVAASRNTASALITTLNADATFSSNFVASVVTIGSMDAAVSGTAFAGGRTVTTMTLTMNEAMNRTVWTTGLSVDTDFDANTVADAANTVTLSAANWDAGTMTVTNLSTSATENLISGTSTIVVGVAATDVKGNAATAAYRSIIN